MTYNLEHLEQLEQGATSGTWELTHPLQNVEPAEYIDEFYSEAWQVWPPSRPLIKPLLKADAELIVAARNALPSLIADLRRERERNAELVEALRPICDRWAYTERCSQEEIDEFEHAAEVLRKLEEA